MMTKDLSSVNELVELGREKGFTVEENKDYGAGPIDLVWNINIHSLLPNIKCGFIVLRAEGAGDKDTDDNQFSIRKIEEAAMRGLRSGMDKVFLVAENKEMAKSVSGRIEWLASHGSLLRLDRMCLGISLVHGSSVVTPSQERVPEGKKIRKRDMEERQAKFEKYNMPKRKKVRQSV